MRFLPVLILTALASAQIVPRPSIRVSGEGSVTAIPDQASISVGVVNQAPTAEQATDENAQKVTNVIAEVRKVIGGAGQVQTVSYSLSPVYTTPRDGSQPMIVGYTASNTVEVTSDLTVTGKVIDAATRAGANRVYGLTFGLKDPAPAQGEALKRAAQRARQEADAIAAGLNVRTGNVLSAAEAGASTPILARTLVAGAAASTPVEPGLVSSRATVTIEVEILQ